MIDHWFRTIGVRQEYLLSRTIFNIFLERIMSSALEDHGGAVSSGDRTINNLRFTDDIDSLAGTKKVKTLVTHLGNISKAYGVEILWPPSIKFDQACAFSVSLTTPCHLTFLTFFIHTNHLERCALLTPLCFHVLASVWRPLAEDLSLFLAPLSGIPYLYLSEKLNVFQLSKRS